MIDQPALPRVKTKPVPNVCKSDETATLNLSRCFRPVSVMSCCYLCTLVNSKPGLPVTWTPRIANGRKAESPEIQWQMVDGKRKQNIKSIVRL